MAAYATSENLATFLGIEVAALPSAAERLLARATEDIVEATLSRIDLTIDAHVDAAERATCAQVEYWIENGEDVALIGSVRSKLAGRSMQVFIGSEGGNPRLAPRAKSILRSAGLLNRGAALL